MSDRSSSGEEYAAAINREAAQRDKSRELRPLLKLWPFIRRYKGLLALALGFLLVATIATSSMPIIARYVIDNEFSAESLSVGVSYFGWFFFAVLIFSAAAAARFYFITRLGERVVADLRKAVYNHITSLSPAFFEITKTGEILSRLTTDTTLIQTVVGSTVSIALRNMLGGFLALVLLISTSPNLAGAALLIIPAIIGPIIVLGRILRRLSRSSQDRVADTSAFAGESLGAIQTVQAFTHEEYDRAEYGEAVESAFFVALKRIQARSVLSMIVYFLVLNGMLFIVWLGARAMFANEMTGGELFQFVGYAMMLAMSAGSLSEVWSEIQRAAGAAERLMELLAVEPQIKAPANPVAMPKPLGRVRFDNITFTYPTRPEVAALNNYSIAVEPGERIALVGPSGAGKTTVFQLLLRFYEPQEGAIFIDGVDIAQAIPQEVRARISVVQQDPVIFSGPLIDNIRYGRPEASDAEVKEAAVVALAHEFIEKLPKGYNTELGERGLMLSGGQRQRIAIARAVLRNAPILLLDEATSALDAESERLVQEALEHVMKGRTTLVIAHRLATVVEADRIIVMDEGRVVDMGTHQELTAKGGLYAHLASLQFRSDIGGEPSPVAAQ